jgi:acetylornithine/succinyldiaminopimelate/putrescine aminotransferase
MNNSSISLRSLFLQHVAQTSPFPPMLEVDRAKGVYIYDVQGKEYIDFISGISVSNVGHCHPNVTEAIRLQSERYMHVMVYGEFVQSPQVKLAVGIASVLPPSLDSVYFVNSGSEATEGALKLAKRFTGRTQLIGFKNAYHGSTQGALSMMGSETFKQAFRPLLPDVLHLNYGSFDELELISNQTAAVLVESIQGEAGIVIPPENWLKALRNRCSETGTLLILDEIQTGFGRTGTFFAFQQTDIIPDILLMAKGMGGGLPIGAFVSSKEIMGSLTRDPILGHITTFGGNAVCCAASLAVLNLLKDSDLIHQVPEKENRIRQNLQHTAIKGIQGKGLLLAINLGSNEIALPVMAKCMELGLITDWFLFADHCLRIAPPLTISNEEIDKGCSIFLQAIKEVTGIPA